MYNEPALQCFGPSTYLGSIQKVCGFRNRVGISKHVRFRERHAVDCDIERDALIIIFFFLFNTDDEV